MDRETHPGRKSREIKSQRKHRLVATISNKGGAPPLRSCRKNDSLALREGHGLEDRDDVRRTPAVRLDTNRKKACSHSERTGDRV